jgi:RNA polymerase subunit RPABC4/transcription elongation factor Spt4
MKKDSGFKYIFWVILVLVVFMSPVLLIFSVEVPDNDSSGLMLRLTLLVTFLLFIVLLIALIVYRDASKRGMDPWYWATIAAFVPFFIGLIIYLLERRSVKKTCLSCGKELQGDFKICPYCGQNQEISCDKCQKAVAPDWKLCPFCGASLHTVQGKQLTQ